MPFRISWMVLAGVVICAAAAGVWAARELDRAAPQLASGTWLPRPRSIGSVSLIDQTGAPFTQARLHGAPSLLYFGFTHCPDTCPATLAKLARAVRSGTVPHLRVIFVTVDPARDSPALLTRYLQAFDPRFIGVTGSQRTIDRFAGKLGVAFERLDLPGGDYTIDHTDVVFLLDASGRVVAIFTAPFEAAQLTEDLRRAAPFISADAAAQGAS